MNKPKPMLSEEREYQLRCVFNTGETEVSKWYDENTIPERMKRKLAEREDIKSMDVIKRIKGLKVDADEEAEEQEATLEGQCGMNSQPATPPEVAAPETDEEPEAPESTDKEESVKPTDEGMKNDMLKFKTFITEELSTGAIDYAATVILKYLRRKTGNSKIFYSLGVERFKNVNDFGIGLRFYAPGKKIESWRFNWKKVGSANYHNISSVDIWRGRLSHVGPTYSITFKTPVSLVQILPRLVDILKKGELNTGEFITYPDDAAGLKEQTTATELKQLTESVDPSEAYNAVLKIISKGDFSKSEIWSTWKMVGMKIVDELMAKYPNQVMKSGRGFTFKGDIRTLQAAKNDILSAIGTVRGTVVAGSRKEVYASDPQIDDLEKNQERLAYGKQLKDLENLIKMTISGASNALFVAGRGGIGKTHTVEKVLASAGLEDGKGYFKNTGTASAAGIYSLLFKYKDNIILFDDSDDALKDQESRNLLKAATDSKKVRKLVWNKMGSKVVDPDTFDGTDEDMIDQGLLPRFFEFTGKIIFISNLSLEKLDPDGALRTRAFLISIDPTDEEVYDFMEQIVGDIRLDGDFKLDNKSRLHIVELLRQGKSKQTANLRKLGRALNMQAGALNAGVNIPDDELKRMIATYA